MSMHSLVKQGKDERLLIYRLIWPVLVRVEEQHERSREKKPTLKDKEREQLNFRNKGGKISNGKEAETLHTPASAAPKSDVIKRTRKKRKQTENKERKEKKQPSVYLQVLQISSMRLEHKPRPRATFAPQLRLCVAQATPLSAHSHARSFQ